MSIYACCITHVIAIISASQLHFWPIKTLNCLVAASKLSGPTIEIIDIDIYYFYGPYLLSIRYNVAKQSFVGFLLVFNVAAIFEAKLTFKYQSRFIVPGMFRDLMFSL